MLTGELPIGRFQPPSQKVQLDVRIDHVVLRALEKEPDRRYQRASEVKTELVSATPPMWHAPAPAVKENVSMYGTHLQPTAVEREDARRRVQIPAAGLMIAGGIGLLAVGMTLAYALLRQPSPSPSVQPTWAQIIPIVPATISLCLSLAVAMGGWHMANLKSYGLAMTGAALATLPCSVGCILGLPMGIWALVVLLDPKVRSAFAAAIAPPARPPVSHFPIAPTASSGAKTSKMALVGLVAVAFAVCAGIIPAVLLPAIQAVRQSASQAQSSNNLKQLGLALHNYHDFYNCLPPAVVRDADGNPLYSGRVLLLPFMGQENLYRSFDLTQSWDSPRNQAISDTPLAIFMHPSDSASDVPGKTNYLFVSGKGTMFEADKTIHMYDITDGLSNTIAMVEVKASTTKWAQPDDLDFSLPRRLPAGSQLVLFGDGSVRNLDPKLTPMQIREFATIGGGESPWEGIPAPMVTPQAPALPGGPLPMGAPAPAGAPIAPEAPATPGAFAPAAPPLPPQPEQQP
jgi:hypothetical protein